MCSPSLEHSCHQPSPMALEGSETSHMNASLVTPQIQRTAAYQKAW